MRLVVLTAVFLLLCGVFFLSYSQVHLPVAGRLALSAMFLFTGVLHINYRDGVYLTYPGFLPQRFRIALVFAMSDLQFAFALGFIFADVARIITLFALIYLFLGLFTQINACVKHISVKRGNYSGAGMGYLFFKIPEQLFIIGWTYYFGLVC